MSDIDIRHLSALAQLKLSEQEAQAVAGDLARIIDMVDQMQAMDTEGVQPLAHPLDGAARLRPDAEIGNDARIGNFVEVKAASIGEGAKVNHLSYIGDAEIGAATNVGAGTVTCNYDGVMKHRTVIGRDVFIGSDTMLVAPVTVGDGAMTASGSVITQDVPEGALALARARQVNKPGLALRLMERLRALKKERKG